MATVVPIVVVAALVGAAWWFARSAWSVAEELRENVLTYGYTPREPSAQVLAVSDTVITLERTPRAQLDGVLALYSVGGRGLVGEVRSLDADAVVRDFNLISGGVTVGDPVFLGPNVRPGNPFSALGLQFDEVAIQGPLGTNPAWLIPGNSSTWIIYVHGWGTGGRAGVNNLLPLFMELDYPVLAITYRGDPAAAPAEDDIFRWGLDAWEDVEAAAQYARSNGAESYILLAHDQGASLASTFLHESPLRARALGVIYDSPVLAVDDVADAYAEAEEVPGYLAAPGKALAVFRFQVRWSRLDQVGRADEFQTPVLLIHGSADELVPVDTSDKFATARPDLVVYERFEGTGHLLAWNTDRSRYELAVRRFLLDAQETAEDAVASP